MPTGVYDPVLPLDRMILELLPEQGALISGIYPDAMSAYDIVKKIPGSDTELISTRTRVMGHFGLVISMKIPKSPIQGYQVTAAGKKFLRSFVSPEVSDGSGSS